MAVHTAKPNRTKATLEAAKKRGQALNNLCAKAPTQGTAWYAGSFLFGQSATVSYATLLHLYCSVV